MPQTYIRAVAEGAVGRTSPVAVSYSRSGGAEPGTVGKLVGDQDCITDKLRGVAGAATRPEHRPPLWHG
jgi:hypothetical protein